MDQPMYSILRIKRKRTALEQPLEALVVGGHEPSQKRRRQSAGANSSPGSSAAATGVFRFADTIPVSTFNDEESSKQLQDRIAAALQAPPHPQGQNDRSDSSRGPRQLDLSAKATTELAKEMGFRTRYRIVDLHRAGQPQVDRRRGLPLVTPPQVRSAAKLAQERANGLTRIYDAVAENSAPDFSASGANVIDSQEDETMQNFVPMLQEYLSLQDQTAQSRPSRSPSDTFSQTTADDGEYVYDVYYRDLRESAETNASLLGGGNINDVSSLAGLTRIGEIAGMDDFEAVLTNEVSSEEEDEADEDSNEENDYRNDYPDEDDDDLDSDEPF